MKKYMTFDAFLRDTLFEYERILWESTLENIDPSEPVLPFEDFMKKIEDRIQSREKSGDD